MGWFSKDEEKKATAPTPQKKYKFEDFVESLPPLPPDPSLEAKVRSLEAKVAHLRVRVSDLEASRLAEQKAVDTWFKEMAAATFCELRDSLSKI